MMLLLTCGLLAQATLATTPAAPLRAPSVPLVAHDPYFSVWLPGDRLTDADSVHWTGRPQPLRSLIRVDGRTFRLLGATPANLPALPTTSLRVLPTRTVAEYGDAAVRVTLTFTTPALPADLDVLSRPVTYLTWSVTSADGQPHAVQLWLECGAQIAVNSPDQTVHWNHPAIDGLTTARLGQNSQPVLQKRGDDLRIDWGYAYLSSPEPQRPTCLVGPAEVLRAGFVADGKVPYLTRNAQPAAAAATALAACWDLGEVGRRGVTRWAMLAYDDLWSIRYGGEDLRPYWRRAGAGPDQLLTSAARDYGRLQTACAAFDQRLAADLTATGGAKYADLCTLAYRQTWAGNKLAADSRGCPLVFPKENFSNGCIATVDVLFPQAPFYLLYSPTLTRGMLQPILDYAKSPLWPYGYAPHDLGTYPYATGQVYGMGRRGPEGDGDRMPVEESGNMLIMLAALAQRSDASWLNDYWPLLTRWAEYLRDQGLDPANQLCSADMFGHLPHCANLALKAIIGLAGYAQLAERLGHADQARTYDALARDYAAKWLKLAADEGRTRLAYDQAGTWGMKHNLIWDRLLGTKLFDDALGDAEVAWYKKVQGPFGLPVDNRTDTCLIDWALWSIAPARNQADFEALLAPLWRYANETPSRVPLSDWFVTTDGSQRGFQARPVVGGLYVRLLADDKLAGRWSKAATRVAGPWAPITLPMPARSVVADARTEAGVWRYTTEKPADTWFEPSFDDQAWASGRGGFGTEGTPGAVIGTKWDSSDIWLRRSFDLSELPSGELAWTLIHDEDTRIYLNGKLVGGASGWSTAYQELPFSPEARAALQLGRNTLAVWCHQTSGGQSIDLGIGELPPSPRRAVVEANPVLPGYFADPSLCYVDGRYYIYATTDWYGWEAGPFVAWRSDDLVNWSCRGLTFPEVTGQRNWAPGALVKRGGRYYLFFSKQAQIHVAVGDSPEGPFKDALDGRPLIPERFRPTQSIDSEVLIDDDGQAYLYWGGGPTWVVRLKPDLLALDGEPRPIGTNDKFGYVEGPFPFKRNGIYYLSGAANGYHNYHIIYGMAKDPMGPFTFPDNNPITLSDWQEGVRGPGHGSVFRDPKTDRWYVCYLRNFPVEEVSPIPRQVAIDRLEFYPDGRLKPARLSAAGVGQRRGPGLALGCSATASSWGGGQYGDRSPAAAVDGSLATRWVATRADAGQWWQVDLGQPRDIRRVEVCPEFPTKAYLYRLETSLDGQAWSEYADHTADLLPESPKVDTKAARARYVRVTFVGTRPAGTLPALWEVRVY